MSAHWVLTDSDFQHLLTDEQRQKATKSIIVELTDEIKALKEKADRDQRELVKAWCEIETLADEVETLKLCVADRDDHAETLKDEIKTLQKMNINAAEKNINACAEIKALKEDLDEFDLRGGSLKVEIDCLTQCLEERDEEIKTLKENATCVCRFALGDNDKRQALTDEIKTLCECGSEVCGDNDKRQALTDQLFTMSEDIIDYMKTTEDSGKCGDNLNAFSSILGTRNSPRFTTLYNNNLHFAFEKADNRQDTEWFKKYNTLYSDFFAHHMKMTAGVFEWSFYEAFLTQNEK